MSHPVFFVPPGSLEHSAIGAEVMLDGEEGRHAVTVKRLARGEGVDLVDGVGARAVCRVLSAEAGVLTVSVERLIVEAEPSLRLVLVQALAKGDRDELAIEAATELGVDSIIPWQSERSIVRWRGDRAAKSLAKWRSVVKSAAKQARRASIPVVEEPRDSAGLLERIRGASRALVLHEEASKRLGSALAGLEGQGEVLFIVGPEGGISPAEVEAFLAAGASTALLGPHVLRSSTAGPAALAIASERLGRWEH